MTTREPRDFLRLLHGGGRFCLFRYLYGTRPDISFHDANDAEEILAIADEAASRGRHTTATLATFGPGVQPSDGHRGRREWFASEAGAGIHSNVVWIDYDGPERSSNKPMTSIDQLLPSIINNSGRGMHFYWLLDEPYCFGSWAKVNRFERALKGLALVFGGDRKATVANECLKPVGVQNINALQRERCRTTMAHPGRTVSLEIVEEFLADVGAQR